MGVRAWLATPPGTRPVSMIKGIQCSGAGPHKLVDGVDGRVVIVTRVNAQIHNADTVVRLVAFKGDESTGEVLHGDRRVAQGAVLELIDAAEAPAGHGVGIVIDNPAAAIGGSIAFCTVDEG